jgi:hypothetical protein
MNANPLKDAELTENSAGIGAVTQEMVQTRAEQLAVGDGRLPGDAAMFDFVQAKQELTGEPDEFSKEANLESAPGAEAELRQVLQVTIEAAQKDW